VRAFMVRLLHRGVNRSHGCRRTVRSVAFLFALKLLTRSWRVVSIGPWDHAVAARAAAGNFSRPCSLDFCRSLRRWPFRLGSRLRLRNPCIPARPQLWLRLFRRGRCHGLDGS
jgi:hypothetical protein